MVQQPVGLGQWWFLLYARSESGGVFLNPRVKILPDERNGLSSSISEREGESCLATSG
jgi:hypothetical protein